MKIDLSNSEWKLMRRLWERAPRTITELTAAVRDETGWSKNTVITMLSRLEAKGAVRHEEGGRAKQYFPAVRRGEAARVESRRLTEADIAELSAILDKAGGERG